MENLNLDKVLGIDISDYSIEILGLQKSFWNRPKVTNYNRATLRPGIVEDGKIIDHRILVQCLKDMLRTAWPGPIKNKLCLMSFPESRVFSRLFKLPASISNDQIRTVLLNEVSKLKIISLSDIYYDWQVYQRNDEELDVFFAAVSKRFIFQYARVLSSVGLIPLAFDLELASLGRALIYSGTRENTLVIDIGARNTKAGFFNNKNLFGSICIPIGGNNFTSALAEESGLSIDEAEAIKRQAGFDLESREVAKILKKEAQSIIDNINDFQKYFENQKFKPASKIILAGGSSLLPSIKDFFEYSFDMEVEAGNPINKISINNYKSGNDFILYANVVGLALRGLARDSHSSGINLLSRADYCNI